MSHKNLFTVRENGYDISEADAYVTFLLSEYNSALEKNAGLQKELKALSEGAPPASPDAQGEGAAHAHLANAQLTRMQEEVQLLQSEIAAQKKLAQDAQTLQTSAKEEIHILQEANRSLTEKVHTLTKENTQLTEEQQNAKPTVEHTSRIIAQTLLDIQANAEQVLEKAQQEGELILSAARAEAANIDQESRQRALRADEFFKESQRRMQEAYKFLIDFEPEDSAVADAESLS